MRFEEWVKKYNGAGIDYDHTYGIQCVDLIKHYIDNVLNISPQSIGNAIEYYNKRNCKYLKDNFTWINNTATFVPMQGDIGIFKSKSGNGHVCVCTGNGNTVQFKSYDQNYPNGKHEPMSLIVHSYNNFLGVLRPKNRKVLFKTNATVKRSCRVYCDTLCNKHIGTIMEGETVYVVEKLNTLYLIRYLIHDGTYKTGFVSRSNILM